MKNILVIGSGNMGGSLVNGIHSKSIDDHLTVFDIHQAKLDELPNSNNLHKTTAVPKDSTFDVVFLCIKPTHLEDISSWLKNVTNKETVIVSFLAGVKISDIQSQTGCSCSVARAMPNICATISLAATAVAYSSKTDESQMETVQKAFRNHWGCATD